VENPADWKPRTNHGDLSKEKLREWKFHPEGRSIRKFPSCETKPGTRQRIGYRNIEKKRRGEKLSGAGEKSLQVKGSREARFILMSSDQKELGRVQKKGAGKISAAMGGSH